GQDPDSNYSGYEAFYALTFALGAAAKQPVFDGPHIATGFESLVSGIDIDVGPTQIQSALGQLSAGATINLRGLWSHLDWNTTKREITTDRVLYCYGRNTDGTLFVNMDSGVRYSDATGTVTGTFTCD